MLNIPQLIIIPKYQFEVHVLNDRQRIEENNPITLTSSYLRAIYIGWKWARLFTEMEWQENTFYITRYAIGRDSQYHYDKVVRFRRIRIIQRVAHF